MSTLKPKSKIGIHQGNVGMFQQKKEQKVGGGGRGRGGQGRQRKGKIHFNFGSKLLVPSMTKA